MPIKNTNKPVENTRIHGSVVDTKLSQLPDAFTYGPHTRVMSDYLSRRWSAHSYGWFKRGGKCIEFNRESTESDRYRWVEHPKDGLRFIGAVHDIRMSGDGNLPYFDRALVDHTGWFTDNYQDELVYGEVYQLPSRDGANQYVPAINDPNNDAAILDFHSVTDDIREAIRDADRMAERYAEDEREYQAKESAKARIEEIDIEVKTMYREFKELARELRANCDRLTGLTHVQQLVRDKWSDIRSEIEALRRERDKLADDFWSITY